ncbi:hypothetical protein PUNSTDRAFT_133764 [Punctularia strigosozonata HHB-11173 SS5]|uniref:uncharacterized protein n=1 Tax=Punctularia strigosozonata (strain HHB-11173) TaxID=741275 RepID=UPI0004416AC2|nr:uncharacterized protein PUNSTDRAFT_133764 [Punctularia strigosozonata HHB-11173 SS5]EIN09995.1 hypothetical protein PUNSTDRAFT_133764 [Punctularia strigosozonata HHB-11173 SS5]
MNNSIGLNNSVYNWVNFEYDAQCFRDQISQWPDNDFAACTFTTGMVSFLNFTGNGKNSSFIDAYCIAPPPEPPLMLGFVGPLVRLGAYLSNLLLAMQIFYSPDDIRDAFGAQILTVYSLIFATSIALFKRQLTKFHAVLSVIMIGSPVTLYLWVYAILSIFRVPNRLSETLGPWSKKPDSGHPWKHSGQLLSRILVLLTMIIWIATVIFIYSSAPDRFAQPSCVKLFYDIIISKFYGAVGYLFVNAARTSPGGGVALALPVILIVVAWAVVLVLQRKVLWQNGWSLRFLVVWRHISIQYPFIHFTSVILLPSLYWMGCIELGLLNTRDNDGWNVSFGQILALFIVVQPLISVIPLIGDSPSSRKRIPRNNRQSVSMPYEPTTVISELPMVNMDHTEEDEVLYDPYKAKV